ncbi:MAG: hypothetical protein F6K40_33975 [Okeania sp. SIO3I5]|uniref:hypothetical protein n=1 Tax=Okeania sp. SIO3I5 TaxID=2607805 RepID=UPI0013BE5781|nr:hypothetical protein [Okeania sp. SIO3I5]NEQ40956.1 hypothetical protein [Okeania sp. SIO3I5]
MSLAKELTSEYPDVNFVLMIHPSGLNKKPDFEKIKQAGISLLRFAYAPNEWELLEKHIPAAIEVGISISTNVTYSSRYSQEELEKIYEKLLRIFSPNIIYLADSCSAFYPNQVRELYNSLKSNQDVSLGFHAHDFLSLAFANSLT